MAVRKTAVNKKKKKDEASPVVTQVVEEVNEGVDLPSQTLEEIKVDAQHIENAVEKLQEDTAPDVVEVPEQAQGSTTIPEKDDQSSPADQSLEADKKREVVEEFFEGEKSGLMPQISMYENNSSKKLIVWALVVVGVALVTGGGLVMATKGKLPKMPVLFAKPTPTPTPAPTPTPTPIQPDRTDLTIEVLNGGGLPGAGSKMKDALKEKGYTVSAVGNAEKYTYKKTELHVKASKSSYLMLLTQDLKDLYTIGTSSSTIAEDASYDAQIIVGKE